MDDQASDNSYDQMQNDKSTYPQTIRYHRPHISQEPIDDTEPEYVTRNRYQTLEESQSGRKHMDVAPSESAYLKDAPLSKKSAYNQEQARTPAKQQRREPRPKQTLTHSARYLETPKQGKSIFISSSRRRKQHRLQIALLIIAIAAIALVIRFIFFK
ncbi:hypothetical protein ACTQY7_08250 [Collinsella sp. LCP19S3_G12]|uniref:hypothetical protein n=1 Tax=Collinsella sp. LCP19S3_G12 TaxID=3438767 RepID=UPI003F90FC2A